MTFPVKPFVNHWRGFATCIGLVLWIATRIAGPPWSYFGFAILVFWLCFLAWDQRDWLAAKWRSLFVRTEYDVERDLALADVAMDSPTGDQQNAKRLADWAAAVQHLETDLANSALPAHQRLAKQRTLAVIRRNIQDVTKAEAKRHAKATGAPLPVIFAGGATGLLPMIALGALSIGGVSLEEWRLHNTKQSLADARAEAHDATKAVHDRDTVIATLRHAAAEAIQTAAHQTQLTENERRISARQAALLREHHREEIAVLGGGDPPSWRLRDDGARGGNQPPPTAPDSDRTGSGGA